MPKKEERPVETPDGRIRNPDGTLRAVRGADGRRQGSPVFGARRLSDKDRGWAADVPNAPRNATRRLAQELKRAEIDAKGLPGWLVEGMHQTAIIQGKLPTDAFEEVAPVDPRRETPFRKKIAEVEAEIDATKQREEFGVVHGDHWHDEVAIEAKDRHPMFRGKGDYPVAVEKVRKKGGGFENVKYGPTSEAVHKRHGSDPYAARRAAEEALERHGLEHRLKPPTTDATVIEAKPVGRPRVHGSKAAKQKAYRERKQDDGER